MIDHILLATPTRIIGHGKESFLSEHWALTPDAPLFAKIDGINRWSDDQQRWLVECVIVTGKTLMDVAVAWSEAYGHTKIVTSAKVEPCQYTGHERTMPGGWSVIVHYAGGSHSGFVVGIASRDKLAALVGSRYVNKDGKDAFAELMQALYPETDGADVHSAQ